MTACASCLKSVCDCGRSNDTEKDPLIPENCIFEPGVYSNVNIEIGDNCQLISLANASKEDVYLCDPCPTEPEATEPQNCNSLYEKGYQDGKSAYYDIGVSAGYSQGLEKGQEIANSASEAIKYQEGYDAGYSEGVVDGRDEVSCTSEYNRGYDEGYQKAKDESSGLDIDGIIGQFDNKTAIQFKYTNEADEEITSLVSQNEDDEWVSDDEALVVDPETGQVSFQDGTFKEGSVLIIKQVEIDSDGNIISAIVTPEPEPDPEPEPEPEPVYEDITGLDLSNGFNSILHSSPTLIQDINRLKEDGWTFEKSDEGSYSNNAEKRIVLANNLFLNGYNVFNLISHEVGHAVDNRSIRTDNIDNYVSDKLTGEGFATSYNIKTIDELNSTDEFYISSGTGYTNQEWQELKNIYNTYGDNENGWYEVGQYIGDNGTTSTTYQNYREYYRDVYLKNYA